MARKYRRAAPMLRHPPLALAYHGVGAVPLRAGPDGGCSARPPGRGRHRALRAWGYELVTFGELAARIARGEGEAPRR